MPRIIFVSATGARQTVEAPTGLSIMRAAVTNDVEGIIAECGGGAACATCHVFIPDGTGLPALSELEDEMLETTAVPRTRASRLSCQITITESMDRLEVHLPQAQV